MEEVFEKRSKQHPNETWQECMEFIKKIDSKKLAIVAYSEIATEYGLQNYQTRAFMKKVTTSKQFGLTEVNNLTIKLTDISKKILYPIFDTKQLEIECFIRPQLYRELVEKYNNKALLNVNILSNILLNEFGITKAAKDVAARIFIENAGNNGNFKRWSVMLPRTRGKAMNNKIGHYVYCTEYRHYRTGKIMRASDYGRTAWRFWVSGKRK